MRINYHTHTFRCGHAQGTDEEYIKSAIAGGGEVLGFSEHSTYIMHPEAATKLCLTRETLPQYVQDIQNLAEKYKNDICIHVGIEAEYFPDTFGDLRAVLRDEGVEYMLLGQHFLDSPYGQRIRKEISEVSVLERYCSQVIEAIQTGAVTYICHPDSILYTGNQKVLKEQLRRICKEAKACDMPLEINLLGVLKQKHYPSRLFCELLAEEGNTVIFGADAHQPERFLEHSAERDAEEMVKEYGLQLVEMVHFNKI